MCHVDVNVCFSWIPRWFKFGCFLTNALFRNWNEVECVCVLLHIMGYVEQLQWTKPLNMWNHSHWSESNVWSSLGNLLSDSIVSGLILFGSFLFISSVIRIDLAGWKARTPIDDNSRNLQFNWYYLNFSCKSFSLFEHQTIVFRREINKFDWKLSDYVKMVLKKRVFNYDAFIVIGILFTKSSHSL